MKMKALKAAFPYTVPILAGFSFLGLAYGFMMTSKGFSFLYPMLISIFVFAGSLQFVAVTLLLSTFNPLYALALTLMVNARHLFYGISMLEKYRDTGKKMWYLIYGMCDEAFSINCTTQIPEGVDKGWFMLFVNLLIHSYWVIASTLGGILGDFIHVDIKGLDFVMTALFVVIFCDQWMKMKVHEPALIGILASLLCLLIFGSSNFIIPSMILMLMLLTLWRPKLDPLRQKEGEES